MGFLSKLFGGGLEQTPLEAIVVAMTLEKVQGTYKSVKNPKLRVPAAISVYALYLAYRFSSGLRDMLGKIDKGSQKGGVFPFDAIVFEAAAFCHFWLMREKLAVNEDEDEGAPEEDQYFECLRASAEITSSLLVKHTSFDLPADLLMQRSIAYSFEEARKSTRPEEKFAQFLVSSYQSQSPAIRTSVSISSSLPLQLSITSYIPIFSSTLLTEFKKGVRAMYLADQEGAL